MLFVVFLIFLCCIFRFGGNIELFHCKEPIIFDEKAQFFTPCMCVCARIKPFLSKWICRMFACLFFPLHRAAMFQFFFLLLDATFHSRKRIHSLPKTKRKAAKGSRNKNKNDWNANSVNILREIDFKLKLLMPTNPIFFSPQIDVYTEFRVEWHG